MRVKLKTLSIYGVVSLGWLVWVVVESYNAVDANRYYELDFVYLAALTIRDQFLARLPFLILGAPLAHLLLYMCRRPRGLATVLTTAIPLGIVALNVLTLNAALVSPFPSKMIRLVVMLSITGGVAVAGFALAFALIKLKITRRLLECAARSYDRIRLRIGRTKNLRYVSHPVFAVIVLVVTAAALIHPNFRRPTDVDGPSFLIILIDTLRADHMGAYGYSRSTTPFIDEWAEGATVFEAGIAQASWTKPSVASLFSSLYPTVHRTGNGLPDRRHVESNQLQFRPRPDTSPPTAQSLPDAVVTVAEVLRNAGYRCGGFINNNLVSKAYGYGQGFNIYTGRAMNTGRVTASGIRWIEKNSDRPFLLYLHYMQPHSPYSPPARYNVFGAKIDSAHVGGDIKNGINFTGTKQLSSDELEDIVALYDGEILYSEDQVLAVLKKLQDLKISQEVVVVLTADHGEEFLDHGMVWHESIHLYEELIRVPLVMKIPGNMQGRRVETPVMQIDIAPTLISMAGLNPPADMQGRSFSGLFEEMPLNPRPIFSETIDYGYIQTIRDGSMKLIQDWENHSTELYNLETDPRELVNLAPQQPDVVAALLDLLDMHNETNRLWAEQLDSKLVSADEELLKKLRSLGYID
jgi:arylsulfatase A-like enzyme